MKKKLFIVIFLAVVTYIFYKMTIPDAYSNDSETRYKALDENLSPEILARLANDKEVYIRQIVASNRFTPTDSLEKLADDQNIVVRCNVTKNKSTPSKVLFKLVNDSSNIVKACNPKTSPYILSQLACEGDKNILYELVENPSTPTETIEKIYYNYKDKYPYIVYMLADHHNLPLNILNVFLSENDDKLVRKILSNPSIPLEILKKFAFSKDYYIKLAIASNESTPKEILETLFCENDSYINREIAGNSNTPINILIKLCNEKDEYIKIYLAENKNCPKYILEKLVQDKNLKVQRTAKRILENIKVE